MNSKCFTIGHSIHKIDLFIELLKANKINCIVDVRSYPYSKYNPQYNKEDLKKKLKESGIIYLYFGIEFGARRNDPSLLFPDGKVNFEKVISSDIFNKGIKRVSNGISKGYHIALMCSEKNPFGCHRFVLVSRGLVANGIDVNHILDNNTIVSNSELEKQLITHYKLENDPSEFFERFKSIEDAIKEGYRLRGLDIAYKKKEN